MGAGHGGHEGQGEGVCVLQRVATISGRGGGGGRECSEQLRGGEGRPGLAEEGGEGMKGPVGQGSGRGRVRS